MLKYTSLIVFLLSLPLNVFAAYDTVQFTQTTDIYLGNGLTLQVLSGSKAAEVTVDANSVTFSMESGSTVTVRSYDKKYLTNNLGLHTSCFENYSEITFNSNAVQSFSITPDPGGECETGRIGGQMLSPVPTSEEDEKLDEQTTTEERAIAEEKSGEGEIAEGLAPGEALVEEKAELPDGEETFEPEAIETKEVKSDEKTELNLALLLSMIAVIVLAGIAAYYFLRKKA